MATVTDVDDFLDEVLDERRAAARSARSGRRPWWQMTRTVRQGFVMSAAYLVFAAIMLAIALGTSTAYGFLAAGWGLLMSVLRLLSALALRRRGAA